MISKFLRPTAVIRSNALASHRRMPCVKQYASGLIPPSQYDVPIPKKLQIGYVMKVHWETIPLFVSTFAAIGLVFAFIGWSCMHKMDLVFSTHSRDCISRTMDLRNPSIHKVIIINQRYEPWPEMQDVLDKMKSAEKRALVRAQTCAQ